MSKPGQFARRRFEGAENRSRQIGIHLGQEPHRRRPGCDVTADLRAEAFGVPVARKIEPAGIKRPCQRRQTRQRQSPVCQGAASSVPRRGEMRDRLGIGEQLAPRIKLRRHHSRARPPVQDQNVLLQTAQKLPSMHCGTLGEDHVPCPRIGLELRPQRQAGRIDHHRTRPLKCANQRAFAGMATIPKRGLTLARHIDKRRGRRPQAVQPGQLVQKIENPCRWGMRAKVFGLD